jgi:hypothetical protein
MRADHTVVVHADGDGLGVSEACRSRMTSSTRVVVIKRENAIVKQLSAQVSKSLFDLSAEPFFKCLLHSTGESVAV